MGTCNLRLPWAMMGAAAGEIQDALRAAVPFPQAEVRPRIRQSDRGNSEHVFTVMVTEAYVDTYRDDMAVVLQAAADKMVAGLKAVLDDPDIADNLNEQDRAVAQREHEEAVKRAAIPLPLRVPKLGGWQTFTYDQNEAVEHKTWAGTPVNSPNLPNFRLKR